MRPIRRVAYCTQTASVAVARAVGVKPYTSPPFTAARFDVRWLEGHEFVYIRLHGRPDSADWYGEGLDGSVALALSAAQLRQVQLRGSMVLIANCYGADTALTALEQSEAALIVAGAGENLAAARRVVGTDLLALAMIQGLEMGLSARQAFTLARARLVVTSWRKPDRDAMKFKIVGGMCK